MKAKELIDKVFNGTVFLQASLKAFELDNRILQDKYDLIVKELDYNNDSDIELWKSLIHTSYDDCHFTTETARDLLCNHPYYVNTQTFVFQQVGWGSYSFDRSI
ncbi:MAG: hypothetical protein IJ524_07170 [Bacteroidales bacterium]|nr:hypothetical protein [Bacteroidales bacterium]